MGARRFHYQNLKIGEFLIWEQDAPTTQKLNIDSLS